MNDRATIGVSVEGDKSFTMSVIVGDDECTCQLVYDPPAGSRPPVPEGGTATYTVALNVQPTRDIRITVSPQVEPVWLPYPWQHDPDITVTGGRNLTFTTATWSTPQTVTLAAAQDGDAANAWPPIKQQVTFS